MLLSEASRNEVLGLISDVRSKLQGNGAGIQREQQEYMGEAMWNIGGNSVISNLDFRTRLFDSPGWETYKGLLRFYAEFRLKIGHEVPQTICALRKLMTRLEELRNMNQDFPEGKKYRTPNWLSLARISAG